MPESDQWYGIVIFKLFPEWPGLDRPAEISHQNEAFIYCHGVKPLVPSAHAQSAINDGEYVKCSSREWQCGRLSETRSLHQHTSEPRVYDLSGFVHHCAYELVARYDLGAIIGWVHERSAQKEPRHSSARRQGRMTMQQRA